MTGSSLQAALRAGAVGLYAQEAGTGLIIAHASWPACDDFARYIDVGDSVTDPGTELASIDWDAAITALDAGEFPSSSGEKRMLRLSASLAGDIPVRLGDAVTGIDDRNVSLLVKRDPPRIRTTPVPPITSPSVPQRGAPPDARPSPIVCLRPG